MTIPKKSKKASKKVIETAEVLAAPPVILVTEGATAPVKRIRVSEQDFLKRLTEKLTHFDANMVLEAAIISAGVTRHEGFFKKDEAREICLQLIKRGGPAFSVGQGIYREVIGIK